jgi:hypothetical protein
MRPATACRKPGVFFTAVLSSGCDGRKSVRSIGTEVSKRSTIKKRWRDFSLIYSLIILTQILLACSGEELWRYNPAKADKPSGLTATADNGQVVLNWPAAYNAAAYNVYYATSPGVSKATGTKSATVVGTSYTQTGLTNGTIYYFVITSVNSSGESTESSQITATPVVPGPYVQGDIMGTWDFNVLVSGSGAGWMRGTLVVDNAGVVSFSSYLDSNGTTMPSVNLFSALFLSMNGEVSDSTTGIAKFHGVIAANRKLIVGNSSPDSTSHLLAILQKQLPGVTFSNSGDIQGFGNTGGGGRRFVYNQLSSGSGQEWEYAEGQLGKDQKTQYTKCIAPSNPAKPGDKASVLNISTDGIVTESLTGAVPQPAVVISRGVMSSDKSLIIGTATDTSGASPRYILRIYQFINIMANDPNTFNAADLGGTYNMQKLSSGSTPMTASGSVTISAIGALAFSSYSDSNGEVSLPTGFSLAVNGDGSLSNTADTSFFGKLSYFKDMLVMTKSDNTGACSLSIALKR